MQLCVEQILCKLRIDNEEFISEETLKDIEVPKEIEIMERHQYEKNFCLIEIKSPIIIISPVISDEPNQHWRDALNHVLLGIWKNIHAKPMQYIINI